MTDGVCEHAIDVAIRMQIGCVFAHVWICVYSTCVTLAEVNERGVTVTEEFVIMIPATPWACVRVRRHTNLELSLPLF